MTPLPSARVSAYIPCYNNAKTVGFTIQGIQNQTYHVDELFVVDDGSTDDSVAVAESLGAKVIRMETNQGRGAVRARAMEAAQNEFVLCCDATNRLPPNFVEIAIKWFSREKVMAVFGRWYDRNTRTALDRWRARHLFRQEGTHGVILRKHFCTYGAVVRKSMVLQAGNYDRLKRHGEDFDLGVRLLALGDVVLDPALLVEPVTHNTLFEVMERYSRWNRAFIETYTISTFVRDHILAWRLLIPYDLKSRDWPAALISATLPYFSAAFADKWSFTFCSTSKIISTDPPGTMP